MKKYIIVMLAGILIGLGAGVSPAQADVPRPRNLQVIWVESDSAAVAVNQTSRRVAVWIAGNERMRYADKSYMTADEIAVFTHLMSDRKFYVRAAVVNREGKRISDYTPIKTFRTLS